MPVRFAISIPQLAPDGGFDAVAFRDYMARAEELGFEGAWVGEQVIGTIPQLGPLETLAYAAATTRRIRLGVSMLVLPLHSPLHLAKSLASIDQLSHGRLDVGVTLGGRFRQFAAFDVDPSTLVARFDEQLRLLDALWTQERVDFEGRFWQLKAVAMEPKPVQKPRPPLWVGAAHPNAIRRAARFADAFMGAGSQSTAQFVEQVKVLREALAENGREGFPIAKRVYLTVDDDAGRARERLLAGLDRLYGYFRMPGLDAVGVSGPPAAIVESLEEVRAAGAELILLNPLDDDREQMERLAAEVVPSLS